MLALLAWIVLVEIPHPTASSQHLLAKSFEGAGWSRDPPGGEAPGMPNSEGDMNRQ